MAPVLPLFRTLIADPPWPERGGGQIKRGADRHYPVVAVEDLPTVMLRSPLWRPHPEGCALWMWTTASSLPAALWLVEALGFRYVTHAVWIKPGAPGLGQRLRVAHELLILARRGKVPIPSTADRPPSIFSAPRRGHSVKPYEAERYFLTTPGPCAELFARQRSHNRWTWGHIDDLGDGAQWTPPLQVGEARE